MSDSQKPSGDKPKRKPFHEEFAEKIIAQLERGIAPWQRPWHPGSVNLAPHNPATDAATFQSEPRKPWSFLTLPGDSTINSFAHMTFPL